METVDSFLSDIILPRKEAEENLAYHRCLSFKDRLKAVKNARKRFRYRAGLMCNVFYYGPSGNISTLRTNPGEDCKFVITEKIVSRLDDTDPLPVHIVYSCSGPNTRVLHVFNDDCNMSFWLLGNSHDIGVKFDTNAAIAFLLEICPDHFKESKCNCEICVFCGRPFTKPKISRLTSVGVQSLQSITRDYIRSFYYCYQGLLQSVLPDILFNDLVGSCKDGSSSLY